MSRLTRFRSPAVIARLLARRGGPDRRHAWAPVDPRTLLSGPIDPSLERLRSDLAPHRRRLWLRRIARRAWIALAAVAITELVLWTLARLFPIEVAPAVGAGLPVLMLVGLLGAAVAARPSVGETALAVDAEAGLGDRIASALALAAAVPSEAGPEATEERPDETVGEDVGELRRFVRRQRRDALTSLATVRADLFRPRFSRGPAAAAVLAFALVVPVVALPNPQDATIAINQAIRNEAAEQADRIDEVAEEPARRRHRAGWRRRGSRGVHPHPTRT